MKKTRKKRIVRRKRRISEREIMRIKRKLKKSARKLRLGAKRTGAYVYGTLRRVRGNPGARYRVGGSYRTYTLEEAKKVADDIFRTRGVIVSIEEHRPIPQVKPDWKYGIYTGRGVAIKKNPAKTKASPIPGKFYRVYWSHPSRGETAPLIFKGEKLRELNISQLSGYWPLREGLKMAKVHFRGPYDSWDNAFMDR